MAIVKNSIIGDTSSVNNELNIQNLQHSISIANDNILKNKNVLNVSNITGLPIILFSNILTNENSNSSSTNVWTAKTVFDRFVEVDARLNTVGSGVTDNTIFSNIDDPFNNNRTIATIKKGAEDTQQALDGTINQSTSTITSATDLVTAGFGDGDPIIIYDASTPTYTLYTTIDTIEWSGSLTTIVLNDVWTAISTSTALIYDVSTTEYMYDEMYIGGSPSDTGVNKIQSLKITNSAKNTIFESIQDYDALKNFKNITFRGDNNTNLNSFDIKSVSTSISGTLTISGALNTNNQNINDVGGIYGTSLALGSNLNINNKVLNNVGNVNGAAISFGNNVSFTNNNLTNVGTISGTVLTLGSNLDCDSNDVSQIGLLTATTLQGGHSSSDGTVGITNAGIDVSTGTIVVKDGIITSFTPV